MITKFTNVYGFLVSLEFGRTKSKAVGTAGGLFVSYGMGVMGHTYLKYSWFECEMNFEEL